MYSLFFSSQLCIVQWTKLNIRSCYIFGRYTSFMKGRKIIENLPISSDILSLRHRISVEVRSYETKLFACQSWRLKLFLSSKTSEDNKHWPWTVTGGGKKKIKPVFTAYTSTKGEINPEFRSLQMKIIAVDLLSSFSKSSSAPTGFS